jgi:hypothetical protein
VDCVRLLLRHGADPSAADLEGLGAGALAERQGSDAMRRLLAEHRARPDG